MHPSKGHSQGKEAKTSVISPRSMGQVKGQGAENQDAGPRIEQVAPEKKPTPKHVEKQFGIFPPIFKKMRSNAAKKPLRLVLS